MIIKKNTENGVKVYSTDPMPESWKQSIKNVFGNKFDGKQYIKWAVYENNLNYIGIDVLGSLSIPINGELECYFRVHLYLDAASFDLEVYAYGEIPNGWPELEIPGIMKNSPVFMSSIRTDKDKNPKEYTIYYKQNECDPVEYNILKSRVSFPTENGAGIGIKADGNSVKYEEYANAKS